MKESLARMLSDTIREVLSEKVILISLAIFLFLGLLSVTWFRGDYFLVSLDSTFPLNAVRTLERYAYIWDSMAPPGIAVGRHFTQFFYQAFLAFVQTIGFSLISAQKAEFYLSFAFSGFSMYYLTRVVSNGKKKSLTGLVSALFYMLNPYAMLWIWHDHLTVMFLYALLPLILALYIRGLKEKKSALYAFLICMISFLATPAFGNPVEAVMLWLVLFSYSIYYVSMRWRSKSEIVFAVRFTCIVFLVWFAFNAWWVLPTIYSLPGEHGILEATRAGSSSLEKLRVSSLDSSMINSFRLLGHWAFSPKYGADRIYHYAPLYSSTFFEVIGFLIPILAFIPFIRKDKDNNLIFFGALALLGLLGMTALQPPAGALYMWLFRNISEFQVFRDPYYRFGLIVTLSYALLVGDGIDHIFYLAKKISRKISVAKVVVAVLCFLLLGVYVWPIWTGDVLASGTQWTPSAYVKVPYYYTEADKWLSMQADDFRLLTVPLSTVYFAAYKWENGYMGMDPSMWLFSKPTINRDTGSSYDLPVRIVQTISQYPSTNGIAELLALLNVKYIVLHKDADFDYMEFNPSWFVFVPMDSLVKGLMSSSDLYLEKTFGQIEFYRNRLYRPLSAYLASNAILIDGGLDELIEFLDKWDIDLDKTVVFLTEQQKPMQLLDVPYNAVVFQDRDLFNLMVVATEGKYVISLPEGGAISFNGNVSKVNVSVQIESEATYEAWMQLSSGSETGLWTLRVDNTTIVGGIKIAANNLLKSGWVKLGTAHLSKGHHLVTLLNVEGEQLPTKFMLVPSNNVNTAFRALLTSVEEQYQKIVFSIRPKAMITSRSYIGWKGVISTTGVGEPDMLVFPSINEMPYVLPPEKLYEGYLNTWNSTLIYVTTGPHPLRIDRILADGRPLPVYHPISIFWETGWAGITVPAQFPVTIPPNQRAIILLDNHIARSIELQTSDGNILQKVRDGREKPFQFSTSTTMLTGSILIPGGRYTFFTRLENEADADELTMQIDGKNYTFSETVDKRTSSYRLPSTIFLESGVHNISIPSRLKELFFFSLLSGEPQIDFDNLFRSDDNITNAFSIQRINPTMYKLHLRSSKPSFFVLCESYHKDWKMYFGQHTWLSTFGAQPVPEKQHLVANGYANAWYVHQGDFVITIYFQAQSLFYSGIMISIITLVVILGYLLYKHTKRSVQKVYAVKHRRENDDCTISSETWTKYSIELVATFYVLLLLAASCLLLRNMTWAEIIGIFAYFCLTLGILTRFIAMMAGK